MRIAIALLLGCIIAASNIYSERKGYDRGWNDGKNAVMACVDRLAHGGKC